MSDLPVQPGIAVIGVAAQLPSGTWSKHDLDYESFFEFLLARGEAYEPIPKERFDTEFLRGKATGQIATNVGAFLKDLESFDHTEFGITAKDARYMPLSLRKLIEVGFLSLRDSGIDYRGRNVGCYVSGIVHDIVTLSGYDDAEAKGSFSNMPAMMANKVSYHLDLRGPSVPVDTACSSSLYATHLAVQALRNGECEAAVVGGCQLNHRFQEWLNYTQGGILSPDGKCKPFDRSADGFGRGEGVVCIVLKRVDDAIRDHDHIYATLLGTGINSAGSAAPVNAPVAEAQSDAAKRAFGQTDRAPQEVDYIELHATGTAIGDPTEANWVGAHFIRDDELLVGSVKGNIGHLEITSFLASLCKVTSMFRTGLIPPNVNFTNPNPAIRWEAYKLRVSSEVTTLRARSPTGRALVAMTSSGIGGANGHCVVESPAVTTPSAPTFWVARSGVEPPTLLVAGGLSPRSCTGSAEDLQTVLADPAVNLGEVALRLGRSARSMTWRSFAVHSKRARDALTFSEPAMAHGSKPPLVFVFSGQGTQYWEMGRLLFQACAPFRAAILDLDAVYKGVVGHSLLDATGLFHEHSAAGPPLGDIWPIAITLPALTMLQLALVDALAAVGVRPDVVIGHSAGETAMLYACGAASKAAALELAIARGQAMAFMEDKAGTMAAVSCSPSEAQELVDAVMKDLGSGGVLKIGCYNSRDAVTLSGTERYIDAAVERAGRADVFARKLRTRVPVHSRMMALCETEYRERVGAVFARHNVGGPHVETYSTKTGDAFAAAFDAEYFWSGTLGPVRFSEATEALVAKHSNASFVEIGPHPVLTSYISAALAVSHANDGFSSSSSHVILCPLRRPRKSEPSADLTILLTVLGQLAVAGHRGVDFTALCGTPGNPVGETRTKLPPYPLARKVVPHQFTTAEVVRQKQHRNGPLNYPQLQVNVDTHPGLKDHVIKDEPIMPASGYIEMAFEFGAKALYQVTFPSLLALSSSHPVPVDVRLQGTKWSVHSASSIEYSRTGAIEYDRLHASGFLSFDAGFTKDEERARYPSLDLVALRERMAAMDMKGFYDGFSSFAQYGPMYQRVEMVRRASKAGSIDLLVEIRGDDGDIPNIKDYVLHPAILDAALHAIVHPTVTGNYDQDLYHLPHRVRKVVSHAPLRQGIPKRLFSYLTFAHWSPKSIVYDIVIVNEAGVRLCTIEGMEVALHGHRLKSVTNRLEVVQRTSAITLPALRSIDVSLSADPLPVSNNMRVFFFARGNEMELQRELHNFSNLGTLSLWLVSMDGPDGDASLGLMRCLRREYPTWKIRAVVFDRRWTQPHIAEAMRRALTVPDFPLESFVDEDGQVQVPLVQPASPPQSPSSHSLDRSLPWRLEGQELRNIPLPSPKERHVIVRITGVEPLQTRVWVFTGERECDSSPVIGVSVAPISSHLLVHEGSLVSPRCESAPSESSAWYFPLLTLILLAAALGPAAITDAQRRSALRVLITHRDSAIGMRLLAACSDLGIPTLAASSTPNPSELEQCYDSPPTAILSGANSDEEVQLLQQLLPSGSQPFLWDHPEAGMPQLLSRDPWLVGDAVRAALSIGQERSLRVPFIRPLDTVSTSRGLLTTAPIFSPSKSYLLVGGVGSLGIHIASWMYERGARHIVLTSRRGQESLSSQGDFLTERLFRDLSGRSDLSLVVAAADATSLEAMANVVGGLKRPLGGCMLLSAVFSDRNFVAHDQQSFEATFPAKVEACRVFERLVDIDSLDFTIVLSSFAALFGNAGQTNYAAANSVVTGMIRKYRRAFAIAAPLIFDTRLDQLEQFRHIARLAMSARDLCDYIEDGIKILRERPIWQYVPEFDFKIVHEDLGPSPLYAHLIEKDAEDTTDSRQDGYAFIVETVCRILDLNAEEVSPDVPLTSYGLDSLSASSLSHWLKPVLVISQIQLLANLTLRDLELRAKASNEAEPETQSAERSRDPAPTMQSPAQHMSETLREYMALLPQNLPSAGPLTRSQGTSIVVTGSTGSLGAHVLSRILRAPGTGQVYALIRAAGAQDPHRRQRDAFLSRGLDVALLDSPRLVVVRCTLEEPFLGMEASMYDEIRRTCARVFHIGWLVDFGLPLDAFASSLRGLVSLISLAAGTDVRPPATLVFASSVSIFRHFDPSKPAPEDPIEDPAMAVGSGYSESKWVAEQLLHHISSKGMVRVVVARVGQLTGGVNGSWKTSEWIPAMFAASAVLKCLPDGDGVVSWLPVDPAAEAMVDVVQRDVPETIIHVRHPRPQSWSVIMRHASLVLGVPIVTYAAWLECLQAAAGRANSKHLEPATRLLWFFEGGVYPEVAVRPGAENNGRSCLMGLEKTQKLCPVLQDDRIPTLGPKDVAQWVTYWTKTGALPQADGQ